MYWPSAQDYNEAIQSPSICFSDEELKRGSIDVTVLGLPKVMSGAFASVYKIISDTTPWAVRCFLNSRADQQNRYRAISDFVIFDDLDCTVPFYYVEEGIRVKGKWYPILKMQWVEGLTLDRFIEHHFRTPQHIAELQRQFGEMALDLLRAGIAHGDLQHGNIIVTPEGLRLVDYDAFYVPALEGWSSPEVGHPNFQHPGRAASHFNSDVDNFSVWLIHLSLLAISIDPELYRLVDGGDDCILFKHIDLKSPGKSPLFQLLLEHPSIELRQAATLILRFLAQAPESVPRLDATQQQLSSLPEPIFEVKQTDDQRAETALQFPAFYPLRDPATAVALPVFEALASAPVNVQLAIAKRNFRRSISEGWNRWFVRNFPTLWCERRLKKANRAFESGHYGSASQTFLQLTEVYEFLATHGNLWKSLLRASRPLQPFIFIYLQVVIAVLFWQNLPVMGALWCTLLIVAAVLHAGIRRLNSSLRDPARLFVVALLRLGYCFGYSGQWKVASNYFIMAARQCKWGIDPKLKLRSLALYAFCRNETGDQREALRFLVIRPEVVENLADVIQSEIVESSFLKRTSAFELMVELARHYFKQRLPYSALPALLAARALYKEIADYASLEVRLKAMDVHLMIGYIYTRKSEWSEAQNTFNQLIELASAVNDAAPDRLRQANLCTALSENLHGDLNLATSLLTRNEFPAGELGAELEQESSVAHMLFYYDRSRGFAFLMAAAGKLKSQGQEKISQLEEYCVTLLSIFRRNPSPMPAFPIKWFDELDVGFVSNCLERSYFLPTSAKPEELSVLIVGLIAAGSSRALLVLMQRLDKESRLDTLDSVFNFMAAKGQLSGIVGSADPFVSEVTASLFASLALRIASDEFKSSLSIETSPTLSAAAPDVANQIAAWSVLRSDGNGVQQRVIFKDEFFGYRGILRFIEMYAAFSLSNDDKSEESLRLYDRLEGYYSANIDRVLNNALARLKELDRRQPRWIPEALEFARLSSQFRGEVGNRFLVELLQHVEDVVLNITEDADETVLFAECVRKAGAVNRSSLVVVDTICDTILLHRLDAPDSRQRATEAQSTEPGPAAAGASFCETSRQATRERRGAIHAVLVSAICVFRDNDALDKTAWLLDAVLNFGDCEKDVYNLLSALYAMCRKVMGEFDAAGCLAGIADVDIVVQELMLGNHTFDSFVRGADEMILELFVDAGDIASTTSGNRSRVLYLAAAFLAKRAALVNRPNRSVLMKLADRLGEGGLGRQVEREIALLTADGKFRRKEFEDALSLYVDYEGRACPRISTMLESVRLEFLQMDPKVCDKELFGEAIRVLELLHYYRGDVFHDGVRSVQEHIQIGVADFLVRGGQSDLLNSAFSVVEGHGKASCDVFQAIARAARAHFEEEKANSAISEIAKNSMRVFSICTELEKREGKLGRLSKPCSDRSVGSRPNCRTTE